MEQATVLCNTLCTASSVVFVPRHQRDVCPLSRGAWTPLRLMTRRPSRPPSSSARSPLGLPCGLLSQRGERRVSHVPSRDQHGGGLTSPPGVHPLRPVTRDHRCLTPSLVVQASQHFPRVSPHDVYRSCTAVDHTMLPSLPTTSVLAVVTSAHALVTIATDEVPWSQSLRTPPFPVTHVLGGDCLQNSR